MRPRTIALATSMLALALNAAPAAAQGGDPTQQVTDTTGAAQVGAVEADVPVRVLSDGDNAGEGGAGGGSAEPQTTDDSTASGQVGALSADAPARVLSDGDNAGGAAGASTGSQSVGDGDGGLQAGGAAANAPIRIASAGDDGTAPSAPDPAPAPVPSPGEVPLNAGPSPGDDPGATVPAVGRPGAQPGGGTLPDGGTLPVADSGGALDGDDAGELPLTGFAAVGLGLVGLMLLTAGAGVRHSATA